MYVHALAGSAVRLPPPPPQTERQPRSWWLNFEALCLYFSKVDSNSLLDLPRTVKEVHSVGVLAVHECILLGSRRIH